MFEKFTDRARRVLVIAQERAGRRGHDSVTALHVLLGCAVEGDGVAGRVLDTFGVDTASLEGEVARWLPAARRLSPIDAAAAVGVDLHQVKEAVEEAFGDGSFPFPGERPTLGPDARDVLERAVEASVELGHNYVGTEHILIGAMRADSEVVRGALGSLAVAAAEIERRTTQVVHRYNIVEQQRYRAEARGLRRGVAQLPADVRPAARNVLATTINDQPTMPLEASEEEFDQWVADTEQDLASKIRDARERLEAQGVLAFVDIVAHLAESPEAAALWTAVTSLRDARDKLVAAGEDADVDALALAVRREQRASALVDVAWASIWRDHKTVAAEGLRQHLADTTQAIHALP